MILAPMTNHPLDSGNRSFGFTTGDASYNPEETYTIVVEIDDPQAERWGFELTIIDSEGFSVGALSSVEANTVVSSGGGRDCGQQTSAGTFDGQTGSAMWTIQWIAPAEGAGSHESSWAGRDSRGQSQPSGVYLARLTNDRGEDMAPARKMILSK